MRRVNQSPVLSYKLGDCSQKQMNVAMCSAPMSSPAAPRFQFKELTRTLSIGEFETSGHSQSLRPNYGEEATVLELETLPFRDHSYRPLAGALSHRRIRYPAADLGL